MSNPEGLGLPGIQPDLVTVSHFHGDHFDPFVLGFVNTYLLVPEETAAALVREIAPRMIVPTHCTRTGMRLLKATVSDVIVRDDRLELDRESLAPGRTTLVLLERSDDASLVLRFLAKELPTYPITKFLAAVLLGLAGVTWMGRRAVRRRQARRSRRQNAAPS